MSHASERQKIEEPGFRVPVLTWVPVEEIEEGAMQQIRNAASHPEVVEHIAVMPDVHQGYGIPVGSVMLTEQSVIPNAVGVDIGCGVAAYNTHLRAEEFETREFWRRWADQVARDVPTGFSSHKQPRRLRELDIRLKAKKLQPLIQEKAAFQLGTLGGGNHFMEASTDANGEIWLLVHSGSRHTGLRIAGHYHELAKMLKAFRGLDAIDDLASLSVEDESGQDYLHDMRWAAKFARESRLRMLSAMARALGVDIEPSDVVDIPHNLAWEAAGIVTHRKGATPAARGQIGIIPGSMGTSSYIVEGLGAKESFESCSHGAGRRMSRNQARSTISEAEFAQSLAGTFSRPSKKYLDEAPGAYKNVDHVVDRQSDLVRVVQKLTPIITLKGDVRARDD
ncbi:MAG: RtcB family protein [Thermomicrobiales bacterium]